MKFDLSDAGRVVLGCLGEGEWTIRPFGAGRFSQTFSVECPAGRYVLRVAPPDGMRQLFYEYRMMRQEPAIHRRLLAETTVPVPPIIAHDFSRRLVGRDYLIMPRLGGAALSEAHLAGRARDEALRQWGGYIAQVHGLREPHNRFGYLGEHRCMDPQATWRDAFAVMYRKELDDIVGCGVYDEETARGAMELLERHLDALEDCKTSRLLHGDIWATNLLVDPGGEVTGVLDFDRACWGDVQWDLAIAEYCGVTQPAFWAGYGRRAETHTGAAAVRRMFYLLYEHQKYIVIRQSARHDDPAAARRYADECLAVMENFRRTGRPVF